MNAQFKSLIAAFSVAIISVIPVTGNATNAEDIQGRVQKVGKLNFDSKAEAPAGTATTDTASTNNTPTDPAGLYQSSCFACHGTGAAGAPILGDTAIWEPRIAQGEATLVEHAINGLNAMPPRGGTTLDDDALKAIVVYMMEKSQ